MTSPTFLTDVKLAMGYSLSNPMWFYSRQLAKVNPPCARVLVRCSKTQTLLGQRGPVADERLLGGVRGDHVVVPERLLALVRPQGLFNMRLDLLQLPVAVEVVARAVGRELADDSLSGKVGSRVGLRFNRILLAPKMAPILAQSGPKC